MYVDSINLCCLNKIDSPLLGRTARACERSHMFVWRSKVTQRRRGHKKPLVRTGDGIPPTLRKREFGRPSVLLFYFSISHINGVFFYLFYYCSILRVAKSRLARQPINRVYPF